jgi:hypothetical protein
MLELNAWAEIKAGGLGVKIIFVHWLLKQFEND